MIMVIIMWVYFWLLIKKNKIGLIMFIPQEIFYHTKNYHMDMVMVIGKIIKNIIIINQELK